VDSRCGIGALAMGPGASLALRACRFASAGEFSVYATFGADATVADCQFFGQCLLPVSCKRRGSRVTLRGANAFHGPGGGAPVSAAHGGRVVLAGRVEVGAPGEEPRAYAGEQWPAVVSTARGGAASAAGPQGPASTPAGAAVAPAPPAP